MRSRTGDPVTRPQLSMSWSRVRHRISTPSVRTRPTSPSTLIAANVSDIAFDSHRCECVRHRLRFPSVQTRPTTPSTLTGTSASHNASTPIGTKPEGLVYPSPRVPLRSCGYLGFRTQPPLNPVGVVYPVPCGLTPLPAPRLTRIGYLRNAVSQVASANGQRQLAGERVPGAMDLRTLHFAAFFLDFASQ